MQSRLQSRTKPGCVRSLGYDPVDAFPGIRESESNLALHRNNKKRSHTQLDSGKQVIAFQDRVITINIKEAQHPLKQEKQVIDKSSIMLKISTKSMHRVLV